MKKIHSVEAIRGLACLLVVFSHFSLVFWPKLHAFWGVAGPDHPVQRFIHDSPFAFLYSGSAAVFVFFVLSGYILTRVAIGRSLRDTVGLVLKRYPRLAIPCVVATVLAFAVMQWTTVDYSNLSVWIQGYGDFDFSFVDAVRNGAWQVFVTGESRYNPILWTMRVELLGSWLIFVLCLAFTRWPRGRRAWLLACTAGLAALGLLGSINEEMTYGLIAFLIGAAIQLYWRTPSMSASVLLLLAGLYFAGTHNTSPSYAWMQPLLGEHAYMVGNFLSGSLLIVALIHSPWFERLAGSRLLMFLGKVSFAVYLIHLCVLASFGVMCFHALRAVHWNYDTAAIAACIASLVAIHLAAGLFQRWVDAPAIRFSNRFREFILPKA